MWRRYRPYREDATLPNVSELMTRNRRLGASADDIAPTQQVVCHTGRDQPEGAKKRTSSLMRWGLIPTSAKIFHWPIAPSKRDVRNSIRSPAFREAMRNRRCLVPADGLSLEWKKLSSTAKQPLQNIGMLGTILVLRFLPGYGKRLALQFGRK